MSEDRLPRMHDDEADIDAQLVTALLTSQFPQWADRRPRAVASSGTDHVTFRLGEDLAARIPRTVSNVGQSEADLRWMPRLAPHLPLAVPEPIAIGQPGHGYPYTWGVYRWLAGEPMPPELSTDRQAAADLAGFVRALRSLDPADAPRPSADTYSRGGPLVIRDALTREAIEQVGADIDTHRAIEVWEACLAAPAWDGAPVLVHADLMRGNVLAHQGRLSAVIDFGALRAADPAVDLLPAWHLFEGDAREVFRAETGADDATWARGLGWALSIELIAIPYYRDRAPARTRHSLRLVEAMLDQGIGKG